MGIKIVGVVALAIALIGLLGVGFRVPQIEASECLPGEICIMVDGEIKPLTAYFTTYDNVTYTLTGNIANVSIIIKKSDITVDGAGYTVHGPGSGTGLNLSSCENVTLRNFRIVGFTYGVHLEHADDCFIKFSEVTNNKRAGIRLYRSDDNEIMNTTALNNEKGIHLHKSKDNFIYFNAIANNSDAGIRFDQSKDNSITDNKISNNVRGVQAKNSSINFFRNNITGNIYGIYLYSPQLSTGNSVLLQNYISNNVVGLWILNSSGHTIYHNNFFSNSVRPAVLHNSHNNNWDNGYEGNYWSIYRGSDTNRDGVGDTTHKISIGNTDKYPLMAKFQQFTIEIKDRFHKVGVVSNSTVLGKKDELSFKLTQVHGLIFARFCIPNALVEPPLSVIVGPPYLNDDILHYRVVERNETHTWIYLTYVGSEKATVTIVDTVEPIPFWFQWWFWGICVLSVTTAAVFRKYLLQRKAIETYKQLLGRLQQFSHLDKAKMFFEADVQRCQELLKEFSREHNVRVRHHEEKFEDALERIGIKEKE